MLHIVGMLERRFPQHGHRLAQALLLLSLLALLAGVIVSMAR